MITLHRNAANLTHRRFGRLMALMPIGRLPRKTSTAIVWQCRCDCGNMIKTTASRLLIGQTRSCGCLRKETTRRRLTTHGMTHSAEYQIYHVAKRRCQNPKNLHYAYYGGRGIKFLFNSFEEFYNHVGPRPSICHSLDRINNNGYYEIGNVKWSTPTEQVQNRRTKRLDQFSDSEILAETIRRKLIPVENTTIIF